MGGLMLGMWLQEGGLSSQSTFWLMIFVGLVAFAMLVQAAVVLALGIGAMKAQKKLLAVVDDLKKKAMPVIASAQDVVREATPKVRVVVDNVVETSHMVRNKVHDFEVTLDEANQKFKQATETFGDVNLKTRGQINRVDGMITSALQATSEIGATIHKGIQAPVRQVAGVVTGLRVGIEALLEKTKSFTGTRRP